ncbi:copper resistance system multicopper oxidase [Shewanella sp. GXUN23E]|uniref:copper resistance system multicopper oxidase n=1 Tax=Shewanella sp. GXUN23E TaxID=3422498 RepID=UPI003D7EA3C9
MVHITHPLTVPLSRRRFVQGLAAGGVLASTPGWLLASESRQAGAAPQLLTGPNIALEISELPVNFTGVSRMATAINGSIPGPTLLLKEGEEVTIQVTNRLPVATSIHWHGILLPYQMDGVPGISFAGIAPGDTFTYRFTPRQHGTYWYHSHSGFQEMTGMYGALIIQSASGEKHQSQQDYVVQLSDWTDENPMQVFSKLKVQSDLYNFNQPTVVDFSRDVSDKGLQDALDKRRMWQRMRMNPTDLADLSAATLTFLMNGTTPAGNWTGRYNPGDRIRLRFINAASNSFFDVRIPGLTMTLIQADGQDVVPVDINEFRFGPGETYDVLVEPTEEAYTLFAQSMDRTGFARGTLAVAQGMTAPVPAVDPVEWLTMADMMGSMSHAGMSGEGMSGEGMSSAGMDHGGMDQAGMNHSAMMSGGMDHSQMQHGGMAMDHSQHGMMSDNPLSKPSSTVRHASSEYGASVDMRVDMPRTSLDDPGIGLRNLSEQGRRPLGHKVLTLADLRSAQGVLDDQRIPTRELELHLTGNMERYSWSFDGLEFGQSTPVALRHNERIRIILQNDTMMTHPMHLHGMWSDLETDQGELIVRRHTLPLQPAQRISFLVTPEDVGRWAWHCHLLFHMDAGMFREVVVS